MAAPATSTLQSRARELVAVDLAARLELGELLLQIAPLGEDGSQGTRGDTDRDLDRVAAEVGLSAAQAKRYRQVTWAVRNHRQQLVHTGVAVSYAAVCAAVRRPGGSADLLLDVCRRGAADGRWRVSATDVEQARRAVMKAQAEERRLARATERAEQARLEQSERHAALAPYRDGIAALVSAKVDQGSDVEAAEIDVVRELAERVVSDGGNPADLLHLGSEIVDRRADMVRAVRKRAGELNATTRRLDNTEGMLRRLAGDHALDANPDEAVERWLATLDRIIIHSVDLAERLRDSNRAAQ